MPVSFHALLRAIGLRVMLAREWWHSGVTYNPLAPQMHRNPYPTYAMLRSKDPVHWSPLMHAWIVSRYADVDMILRDHKRFSSDARNRRPTRPRPSVAASPDEPPTMLFLDPPDHTRLRAMVNKAFTPPAIAALTPRIRAIAEALLDQIPDPAAFDVIETLATPRSSTPGGRHPVRTCSARL
jgi:cytochrome P450